MQKEINNAKLNVAIIGCGKVADSHAAIISSLPYCKIIGVCDNEPLMAEQMHERYKTSHWSSNAAELLHISKPDIVHLTTPPSSHYSIGKMCLEAGCHIYVEKPFTINSHQALELIQLATTKNKLITTGTNIQYSYVSQKVRNLIAEGYLGGPPVHIESIFCYSLKDDFAKAFLGDMNHWVRKLPGKLLHNIISHGIARVSEFLTGENIKVIAAAHSSKEIISKGGDDFFDELRVILKDEIATTAYFTFSSQIGPPIHQFRLYGPKNGLIVDDDHQMILKMTSSKYKSYLNYFIPPITYGRQYFQNSINNITSFFNRKLNMDSGKAALIEAFYNSILNSTSPPISYSEIIRSTKIMDQIFDQINR